MGHIMKRKKKGRPSKADIARRAATAESPATAPPERDLRRSLRRRNVIYHIDYDDYIDEDDEEDERREKKLKLLLKLQAKEGSAVSPIRNRRVAHAHAPADSAHSSDQAESEKLLSKSKIAGDGEIESGVDEDDGDDKVIGRKAESKGTDSVSGTPLNFPPGFPLPDKKSLELILDKLQKKDKYGVYAEPVDPEELPDYHDVIKHPMDFATVRKKLGDGSYSTLEQFESDVFLICTNAMQYNTPDTIYYRQARAIQELATKKFQKLRIESERPCKELKSEQTERTNVLAKKQIKKPMNQTMDESVGSGFSKGTTPATTGDFLNASNGTQFSGSEKPINADELVERNASMVQNIDKAEDLQLGKGLLSKFARKAFVHDENPRATYNLSNQSAVLSDSIFTTFDGEIKQLVVVGLHTDHSYARSLARFAATLGPVAWKVASQKIEQSLPPGFKFGHGWVGEYEPLPTPVLMLENYYQKDGAFPTKLQCTSDRKEDKTSRIPVSVNGLCLEGQSFSFHPDITNPSVTVSSTIMVPIKEQHVRGSDLVGRPSFFCSAGTGPSTIVSANYQQKNLKSRGSEPDKMLSEQVELNSSPTTSQSTADFVAEKQVLHGPEMPASRLMELESRSRNLLQPVPFKQPDVNGLVSGGLPNGEVMSNYLDKNRMVISSMDGMPTQLVRSPIYFPHGQEQGPRDSVQLMRMLAENSQKQQKSLSSSPVDMPPVMQSVLGLRRDNSSDAAANAARAWMHVGSGGFKPAAENTITYKNHLSADSLNNPARELQAQVSQFQGEFTVSGTHFQPGKNNFPLHALMTPPVQAGKKVNSKTDQWFSLSNG